MTDETAAAFRLGVDAFNRGDLEAMLAGYSTNCRYQIAREHPESRLCTGREEIGAYLAAWREQVDQPQLELIEVEVRDRTALLVGRFSGLSRGSEVPIEVDLAMICEFDDEAAVTEVEEFLDPEQARKRFAAG